MSKSCSIDLVEALTHPGIRPKPPSLLPTPRAPFRPNSTATRPKGSSREGIRANWQRREFGFGVHSIRIKLHEAGELFRSESTVKINNGSDGDELNGGLLF